MTVKVVGIRKSFIYYALLILLLLNFALLAYIYFFFLREFSHQERRLPEVLVQEDLPPIVVPPHRNNSRSFIIDYDHDVFLKDGQPFQYVAGSLHYFRVPRVYWRDRLRKYRAAGLNVVCTYVEWSLHEPSPGNYQFKGEQDLEYFLQLAVEEDLLVILRPGPYICAERDFGGLPPWLLNLYPSISLRTNDPDYQKEVKKWLDVLFERMAKYLYGNNGPIIMVQVENEYGSFGACNPEHKIWLRDEMKGHVGNAAVLFTTDGNADYFLRCGKIPGVYATIDFGTSASVTTSFDAMRQYEPKGPLVNSEFYPGWLSHWYEPIQRVNTSKILCTMKGMLDMKANFNIYMFYGGTNFGFMNGANYFSDEYQPQLTSYDYDAPLDEAGDPTPKYYEMRNLISKYFKLPNLPVPKPTPKGKYGKVRLAPVLSLFDRSSHIVDAVKVTSKLPKTFEEMNIKYGYVLYETTIPYNISDPSMLYIPDLRDRATVYVDHVLVGILSRQNHIFSMPILAPPKRTLSILVENQGRINFGNYLLDRKGILSAPFLNGQPLHSWTMIGLPFDKISWTRTVSLSSNQKIVPPAYYTGELILPENEDPVDTYVDLTGWGKGVIFVNDYNLGRYWPSIGSQVTLYVPGCYLRRGPEKNYITVFETEYTPANNSDIVFTDKPSLDKIPPSYKQTKAK